MKHQQILDKIGRGMPEAVEDDLRRIIFPLMCYNELTTETVLSKLMPRWNCVLLADKGKITPNYKDQVILAIVVLLHKYGLSDIELTKKALTAIDTLNKEVVLSDAFYNQSNEIKEFIQSEPIPLKKKP